MFRDVTMAQYPTMPTMETSRLRLRAMQPRDAAGYHALQSDPMVMEFLGPLTGRTVEYYRCQFAASGPARIPWLGTNFAVVLKETDTFIGRCGFLYDELEVCGWDINIALSRSP